ncbi:MAG: glycosyltransferase family 39 protein [Chlamydiae bacterium]|nr:glycosyltransferase family 39 protein [Chlamydiota bacterium]MBI3276446.1 glycosyltransferase family 39 protein [Chlamydiota bacterium]
MKKNLIYILVLLTLSLVVFFFKLGSLPLFDPDEPRYAGTASEMMESKDWINPQFNGEDRWDKPVLFYWFIAGAYQLFGISEWSARFPSALFGLLSLFLVFFWAWKNNQKERGFLAALILGTSVEFCIVGRLSITDMSLSFFKSLALVIAFESWRRSQSQYILFTYILCAIAFLIKGPVGLVLPAMIFFIFLAVTKNLKFLKNCRVITGLIVFVAVGLPWYIAECLLHKGFFEYFFIFHNVKRFATEELRHTQPFIYYFGVVAVGFFPWCVFIPRTFKRAIRDYWKDPFSCFLIVWVVVEFLFFSFSKAKLATYILSIFLPLSLLVAQFFEDELKVEKKLGVRIESIFLSVVFIGLVGLGGWVWLNRFPEDLSSFLAVSLPILFGFLGMAIASFYGGVRWVFRLVSGFALLGFVLFVQLLAPKIGESSSIKELARPIRLFQKRPERIISSGFFKPSLVFYLKPKIERVDDVIELKSLIHNSSNIIFFMKETFYFSLSGDPIFKEIILLKRFRGKVVVTNLKSRQFNPFEKS